MDTFLGICIGVGLAAACGFRVFVPLLVLSVGAKAGIVDLGENFTWLSTWPAIVALSTAAALEVGAYFVPWLDHALDTIATPAAVVAGTLVAASQFESLGPVLTWASAAVAGGGIAGAVQAATVTTRGASTAITAGVANPVISGVQSAVAAVLSILAVVVPVVAVLVLLVVVGLIVRIWLARRRRFAAA